MNTIPFKSPPAILAVLFFLLSCGDNKPSNNSVKAENMYDEAISTSYTVALPDDHGEGLRITYTFFDMKRADTGNFKMTHVYMRHTGTEDTTIVNGTWKRFHTDTGDVVITHSGRSQKKFFVQGIYNLLTLNSDSMIADTGLICLRQKNDNDMRNSTVHLFGRVEFEDDHDAVFIDEGGDSLPLMKISAFPELLSKNDSVDLNGPGVKGIELLGTIQIRMAMDGRSTQRALIVEEVGQVR